MHNYISYTKYNSFIISFLPLNFNHAQWLNMHDVWFVLWMKVDEKSRWNKEHPSNYSEFFIHKISSMVDDRGTWGLGCTII